MDDEHYPLEDAGERNYSDLLDEHQPFWTTRRIVLTIIILITLIAFIAYSLQGLFLQPPSPLPPTRLPPMI